MRKTILLSIVLLLSCLSSRLFAACANPTVTASNITINSFVGSWSGVPAAANFEYTLDQTAASPVVPGIATTNANHIFTGLQPATNYYLHVRAYCGAANGYSAWITVPVTTLSLPPCSPPAGLVAYGLTNFSASIVWNAVPGAQSYQFVLNQIASNPAVQGVPTALTYYNASSLQPGTTYYFHLRTDCSAYTGDTSVWETIQFTTPPIPPCQAATGFVASSVTNVSADVTWNSFPGVDGWEYVLDQSTQNPVFGALTTTSTLVFTGLVSNTVYYLHLRTDCSVYAGDSSGWVMYSFITKPDSCVEPDGLQLAFVYPSTAFASWNAAPGAYAYEYLVNQEPGDPAAGGTPTFNTFNEVTGLASSTTYYLHVRAVCDTSIYGNNYTDWVNESFYTLPGLNVNNVAGNAQFTIAAFPNPVGKTADITLNGVQKGNGSLTLTDVTGKVINWISVAGQSKLSLDMEGLAPGVYLLRYADNEQVYTLRLMKQ